MPSVDIGTVETLRDLAQAARVSPKTTSEWKAQKSFPVNADGTYSIWDVCKWRCARDVINRGNQRSPEDDELGEGDSPALEVLRTQKAILAGYDVEEKRGNLLPRADVLDWLMQIALALRRGHERIRQEFGEKAHDILEDSLRDANLLIEERFGTEADVHIPEEESDS